MRLFVLSFALTSLLAPLPSVAAEKTCLEQYPKKTQLEKRINCVDRKLTELSKLSGTVALRWKPTQNGTKCIRGIAGEQLHMDVCEYSNNNLQWELIPASGN